MEWLSGVCVDSGLQDKESPVDNTVRRYTAHSVGVSGLPSQSVQSGLGDCLVTRLFNLQWVLAMAQSMLGRQDTKML